MLTTQKNSDIRFLNVYNDFKTFAGIKYIIDQVDLLPQISAMVGDFNLKHSMWDSLEKYNQRCLKHLYHTRNGNVSKELITLAQTEL